MPAHASQAGPSTQLSNPAPVSRTDDLSELLARIETSFKLLGSSRDDDQRRRLLKAAFIAAEKAWAKYPKSPDAPPSPVAFGAATNGVCAARDLLSQTLKQLPAVLERWAEEESASIENPPSPLELRYRATKLLLWLTEQARDVDHCKQFAQAFLDGPHIGGGSSSEIIEASRQDAQSVVSVALTLQPMLATYTLMAHESRMKSHDWPQAVVAPIMALSHLLRRGYELFGALNGADTTQARTALIENITGVFEVIDRAADRFAEAAAENWSAEGDGPERWRHALEYAEGVAVLMLPAFKLADELSQMAVLSTAPQSGDEAAPCGTAAEPAPAAPPQLPESAPERRRARRRSRRSGNASQLSPPTVTAAPDARAAAMKEADNILRKGLPLTVKMVAEAQADPLALARRMKKDTQVVELMVSDGHDPLSIASITRSSVQSWFGSINELSKVRAELLKVREDIGSLAGEADAQVQARIDRLDERIEALELVNARVDADEADALKRHEFPRGKHVQRMLQLREVAGVTPPMTLPSQGDETLFELQVRPRPLADGSRADPLFVHVHTAASVSETELLSLQFTAFKAIHVKTAKQKNLGARWEQMQNRLGNNDAQVHRGKIGEILWEELKRMMRSPGPGREAPPRSY